MSTGENMQKIKKMHKKQCILYKAGIKTPAFFYDKLYRQNG